MNSNIFEIVTSEVSDNIKMRKVREWCETFTHINRQLKLNPLNLTIPSESTSILFTINDYPVFTELQHKVEATKLLLKTINFDIDSLVSVGHDSKGVENFETFLIRLSYTPTYNGHDRLRLNIIEAVLKCNPTINLITPDGIHAYGMLMNNHNISTLIKNEIVEMMREKLAQEVNSKK